MGLMVVEGLRAVEQALDFGAKIEFIALDEKMGQMAQDLATKASEDMICIFKTSVFETVADTVNSQGIMAIAKIPEFDPKELLQEKKRRLLLIDRVQDPGNFGTLIRTADAAGFDGVLCTKGTVDAYSNKVNRAAMGSNLYLPIYYIDNEALRTLSQDYALYAAALQEEAKSYLEVAFEERTIIAVGNEANGLGEQVLELAKECIIIPIHGRAESLNVAIAGAILMYKSVENLK